MLTDYAVHLYEKLLHRLVGVWACPVHRRLVDTDASKHNIRCIRNVDAEDADEFGYWLPEGLDGASYQPVEDMCQRQSSSSREGT